MIIIIIKALHIHYNRESYNLRRTTGTVGFISDLHSNQNGAFGVIF